jgi:hypothetical protein
LDANSTGASNSAFGYHSLSANTTANSNSAFGIYSLYANTTGANNTAVGRSALEANTTAGDNVAIGDSAMLVNTTGSANTAMGSQALDANTTGANNTAIGRLALTANTTGELNTAVGYVALRGNTTGVRNVALGYDAGGNVTTGSYGVYLGMEAKPSSATTNEIVIGYNATGKGNNTGFIYPPGGGSMYQATNTTTWAQTSDKRLKKNIVNNDVGLSKINAIQIRNFNYKTAAEVESDGVFDSNQAIVKIGTQLGVIAQELELICPECVTTESTGVKTVVTDNVMWHMLNAIKELSTKNDALEARITALEG